MATRCGSDRSPAFADDAARSIQTLDFGQGINGTVAQQRRPIVATHIQQSGDPTAHRIKALGIRAYASNPLVVDGQLIGTLAFGSRTKDTFSAEEIAVLETVAHYATIAYERIRLVDKLKDADRRKDEFLATLAHELRNPLAPVRNSVAVIRHSGTDSGLIDRATAIMDRQLSHMVRLIDDLLDVARITTGKLELRKARVELSPLLMNAVEANRPLIDQMGHELKLALPPMIHVHGDPVRLTQVISNLLNNAAKYTDKGGRIVRGREPAGTRCRHYDQRFGCRHPRRYAEADFRHVRASGPLADALARGARPGADAGEAADRASWRHRERS